MKLLRSIKDLIYNTYISTEPVSIKDRFLLSYIFSLIVVTIEFFIYLYLQCTPVIIFSFFLILVLIFFFLKLNNAKRLSVSVYVVYFMSLFMANISSYFLGWAFTYSVFTMILIPIIFYYLFLINEYKKPMTPATIMAFINLLLTTITKYVGIIHPTSYRYEPSVFVPIATFNCIASGLLLIHFSAVFIADVIRTRTELEKNNSKLVEMALYDSLTGLRNRQSIGDAISKMIEKANADKKPFTLILADIDDFKAVNEQYGHTHGDKVLSRLGSIFMQEFPEDALICRWGGEEFLVALPYDVEHTKLYCNKIRHKLSVINFMSGKDTFKITVTFGIEPLADNKAFDKLIQQADDNLFLGKQNGKDCIAYQNFYWRY